MFQNTIQQVLQGIPGVCNISDDMFVFSNPEDHHKTLDAVLRRLHENGLNINLTKFEFYQPSIKFQGYIFSKDGLSPDAENVAAVYEATAPKSPSEVRSLLASYYSRFIPNMATITDPLRRLTSKTSSGTREWPNNALGSGPTTHWGVAEQRTGEWPNNALGSGRTTHWGVAEQRTGEWLNKHWGVAEQRTGEWPNNAMGSGRTTHWGVAEQRTG